MHATSPNVSGYGYNYRFIIIHGVTEIKSTEWCLPRVATVQVSMDDLYTS